MEEDVITPDEVREMFLRVEALWPRVGRYPEYAALSEEGKSAFMLTNAQKCLQGRALGLRKMEMLASLQTVRERESMFYGAMLVTLRLVQLTSLRLDEAMLQLSHWRRDVPRKSGDADAKTIDPVFTRGEKPFITAVLELGACLEPLDRAEYVAPDLIQQNVLQVLKTLIALANWANYPRSAFIEALGQGSRAGLVHA